MWQPAAPGGASTGEVRPQRGALEATFHLIEQAEAAGCAWFAMAEPACKRLIFGRIPDAPPASTPERAGWRVFARSFSSRPPSLEPWRGWPAWLDAAASPVLCLNNVERLPPSASAPLTARAEGGAAWRDAARRIISSCAAGELSKAVLAHQQPLKAPPGRRFSAAESLRAALVEGADVTAFALSLGDGRVFFGRTPERLFTLRGSTLQTHALAGTVARTGDDAADATRLMTSAKDAAEHRLVIEAIAEALAPWGEVEIAPTRVRHLPRLMHLETPIHARLGGRPDVGALIDALHPTPALGGTPRAAAAALIEANEPFQRGGYGAPIGWIEPNGDVTCAVAIRSALLAGDRAWAFAGAGLVADSDPEAEWAEVQAKHRSVWAGLRCVSKGARR